MRLIINASILVSTILKNSIARKILLSSGFEFYLPEYSLEEIKNHKKMICKRSGLGENEVDIILTLLSSKISIVSAHKIKEHFQEAEEIIGKIDKKDTPFIALALSLSNDGIWTHDKHFEKQNVIRIWKTEDLIDII